MSTLDFLYDGIHDSIARIFIRYLECYNCLGGKISSTSSPQERAWSPDCHPPSRDRTAAYLVSISLDNHNVISFTITIIHDSITTTVV